MTSLTVISPLVAAAANINVPAYIEGVSGFTGAQLAAPDLRAGAALVLAALAAEGISEIEDIEYIQRGYEDFEGKLRSLGALIERVDSERDVQKFKLKIG